MSSSSTSNASAAFSSSPGIWIAFLAVAKICGTKPLTILTSSGSPDALVTSDSTAFNAATLTLSEASFRPFRNKPPSVAKCCVI